MPDFRQFLTLRVLMSYIYIYIYIYIYGVHILDVSRATFPGTLLFPLLCRSHQQAQSLSKFIKENLKIKICRTIILSVVLYGCET
jgi:hypothetical protein